MVHVEGYANAIHRQTCPLKSKRVGNKKASWITDNVCREMHKRDFLKNKAMLDRQYGLNTEDPGTRQIAKLIKKAKGKYFIDNL